MASNVDMRRDDKMTIGEFIRDRRERKGYSLSYTAHRVGLSPHTIEMIEEDEAKLRLETAIKLSKAIGFSLDEMADECAGELRIEV